VPSRVIPTPWVDNARLVDVRASRRGESGRLYLAIAEINAELSPGLFLPEVGTGKLPVSVRTITSELLKSFPDEPTGVGDTWSSDALLFQLRAQ